MNDKLYGQELPEQLPNDPMHWADAWLQEAFSAKVQRNANSMTLVSVASDGQASARIVLCKEFVPDPGYLVFYTNYNSAKARQLSDNPRCAALIHWDALGRQIRIQGTAVRSPDTESDAYFSTRDWGSQLGAWGSDQSEAIESREALVSQIRARAETLGLNLKDGTHTLEDDQVPQIARPPHWGGFRIWADSIELWIEGKDRIHDRAYWKRELVRSDAHNFTSSRWIGTRLQP